MHFAWEVLRFPSFGRKLLFLGPTGDRISPLFLPKGRKGDRAQGLSRTTGGCATPRQLKLRGGFRLASPMTAAQHSCLEELPGRRTRGCYCIFCALFVFLCCLLDKCCQKGILKILKNHAKIVVPVSLKIQGSLLFFLIFVVPQLLRISLEFVEELKKQLRDVTQNLKVVFKKTPENC